MPDELRVTRIGHSYHLIQLGAVTLLTDPWFTATSTYDPGEVVAMSVADLPRLDAVVITHEHYDHCDLGALSAYPDLNVPIIAPGTVVGMAQTAGFRDVRLLEAWDTTEIADVRVTATGETRCPRSDLRDAGR